MGRKETLTNRHTFAKLTIVTKRYLKVRDPQNQVERIIKAFGGVAQYQRALAAAGFKVSKVSIYRLLHAEQRGPSAGLLPDHYWPPTIRAARLVGVQLDPGTTDMARITKWRLTSLEDRLA